MSKLKSNVSFESEPSFSNSEENCSKTQSKELLRKHIAEETKMVKGKFRAFESPDSRVRIQVRKYLGVPMFDKWMQDGEIYEIPLYVARHLNGVDVTATKADRKLNSCAYPVSGFKMQNPDSLRESSLDMGIPVPIVGPVKWVRRYAFESLEFDMGE